MKLQTNRRTRWSGFVGILVVAAMVAGLGVPGADADVLFFTDEATFDTFMQGQGQFLLGVEDFEESTLGSGSLGVMDDPLDETTDNLYYNPGDILPGLLFQSNTLGGNPSVPSPRGLEGLAAVNAWMGTASDWVSTDPVDSLDMILLDPTTQGSGFDLISLFVPNLLVRVYGPGELLLATTTAGGSASGGFLGIWSDIPIGRVNLDGGYAGMDNVQVWNVPEPATLSLLALGGLAVMRRRRRVQ